MSQHLNASLLCQEVVFILSLLTQSTCSRHSLSLFQDFFSYLGALKGIYDHQSDRLEEAEKEERRSGGQR